MSNVFEGLPGSLRIGPYEHRVDVKHIPPDDNGVVFGQFSPKFLTITINPDDHPHDSHIVDTFLHEVLHGLFCYSGIELKAEEQVCELLGTGLMQVLRDSPELLAWLTKALRAKS